MGKKFFLFALVFFVFLCPLAESQTALDTGDLIFKIAVYGPSDEIFIWWGHAALIVDNTQWGFSRVFDWGIFSYPSDNFLVDFVKNRVQYQVTSGSLYLKEYTDEDRDITIYTLDLDEKSKEDILSYAENKVLPENCYYDYHEFKDNCSTGVRDILNLGTGGQLKAAFDSIPGRLPFRQHVRRYTSAKPVPDWILDFLMGRNLDKPISVWDEMFLPREIGRNIKDFRYKDNSGAERDLVKSVEIIHASKSRVPVPNEPFTVWPLHLSIGINLAFIFLIIKKLREVYPETGRIFFGLLQSLLGLIFGGLGCVLFFGLFILPYDYIRQNINILFINPLFLFIVPLGILTAFGLLPRFNPEKYLRFFWAYIFAAGFITILIGFIPGFFQHNQPAQMIILPMAFILMEPEELFRKAPPFLTA
ncbi:MAG: DUF4105 domain-containing protein [Treponema sp.]|nr:DUF4105 domain-containing protein [Treponema sp.]